VSADYVIRLALVYVLATALFGMVTRPMYRTVRDWWTRQTVAAAEQITVLQTIPLPARGRHSRRHFKAVS
jgi:hypothetical protein